MPAPIRIQSNPIWVDRGTRPTSKYAPVIVEKEQSPDAVQSMKQVLEDRVNICRLLATQNDNRNLDGVGWFSFLRAGPSHEPHLRSGNVPVVVISGGNALKVAKELNTDFRLAWHPMNLRNEPLYLLVHALDFRPYQYALSSIMGRFRNMHLIGWDGGKMTGFGAARAAALAFADSLPYRPQRILLMDQDVVQTEGTRHTRPEVQDSVATVHYDTGKPIVGLGVGYPTRESMPRPFTNLPAPDKKDFTSPSQQFVSIQAPFRKRPQNTPHPYLMNSNYAKKDDGIYPAFMVAGGEDMLMSYELELIQDDQNITLRRDRIRKKLLVGPNDQKNLYWNNARVETLEQVFLTEKNTLLYFEEAVWTLDGLMQEFHHRGWQDRHPSPETYNHAACVIERIILRYFKIARPGTFGHNEVFQQRKGFIPIV
jgi:hypothetical protein